MVFTVFHCLLTFKKSDRGLILTAVLFDLGSIKKILFIGFNNVSSQIFYQLLNLKVNGKQAVQKFIEVFYLNPIELQLYFVEQLDNWGTNTGDMSKKVFQ